MASGRLQSNRPFQNAEMLQSSISECEARDLKRLEVELRLIQVSFCVILLETGNMRKLPVDMKSSFDKAMATCAQFPDTSGVFVPIYQSLKKSYEGKPASKELYSRESREFWRLWGRSSTALYGHPYSTSIFPGCPECGRKVETKKQSEAVDHGKYLYEEAFVQQLMKMSAMTAVTITTN